MVRSHRRLGAARLALVLAAIVLPAHATLLTWDADTGSVGAQDGGGIWDTANANWWTGAANATWNNATPDQAIFGAASGVAGTVTLGSAITAGNITFNAPGAGNYVIAGVGNTLTLSGSPTIAANVNATLAAPLAGTGFTKSGAGTLTLAGNNTYTGATIVSAGTLRIGNQAYLITNNTTSNQAWGGSLGYDFTVAAGQPITVTHLGFYDAGVNGLTAAHNVYITSVGGGTTYAAAVVPAGTGAALSYGYRFVPLATPVVLAPGNYTVWGDSYNVDPNYNTMSVAMSAGPVDGGPAANLTFIGTSRYGNPPGNTYPTNVDGGPAYRYGGASFQFYDPDVTYLPTGTAVTLSAAGAALDLNGISQTIGSLAGVAGTNVYLGGGTLTAGGDNSSTTFAGTLSGTGGLTKAGSGTLILSGANTYSGATTVNAGALRLTNSNALSGSSGVTVLNTTVAGGTGTQLELQNNITVNGVAVTLNSNNASNYRTALRSSSGNNVWNGDVILNGNGLDQLYVESGTFRINGDLSAGLGGFTGTIFVRGGGGTGTIAGSINAPNAVLNKTDNSTWVVGAAGESYVWGNTQVSVGTLRMGAANVLPSTTLLTMGQGDTNSATLDLNGNSQTVSGLAFNSTGGTKAITSATAATLTVNNSANYSYGGVLSGAGLALTKQGSGSLTLGGSAANTYGGLTTVAGGVLTLQKSAGVNAVGGNILVNAGTLSLAAAHQIPNTADITVNGSAIFTTQGNAETVDDVTINSTGASVLSNLTVNGVLTITAGILHDVNSGASLTANAMSLSGASNLRLGANSGDTTLHIGAGGLTMNGATLQLGQLGGAPTALVNLAGDFTGTGSNSILNPNTSGPRFLDLMGATRVFDILSGTTSITPVIRNGGLTKTGAGTLVLSAASTYAGATIISGGTLAITGNGSLAGSSIIHVDAFFDVSAVAGGVYALAAGQTLTGNGAVIGNLDVALGSLISAGNTPGHLLVDGSYVQSGTMLAELGGTGQGTTYDWIEVVGMPGTAVLGGVINVDLVSGFVPQPGDYFDVLTATGGISGFGAVTFDFADAQGGPIWWPSIVELPDGSQALRLAVSPEPATLTLLALGGLALLRRRGRRGG